MSSQSQTRLIHRDRPLAIAVAGVAGSGKSTLGRALAGELGVPMLDLDTLTNPLLDSLAGALGGHWLASPHSGSVRAGRYAVLRSAARECLETVRAVVLVAPFTAELQGGADWAALQMAVEPATVVMVHIVGDAALFESRRSRRGAERDRHRPADRTPPAPAVVPVITVDASLGTQQQALTVWAALEPS